MSARDFVEKDYYAALGVPKDATAADIKKAHVFWSAYKEN